MYQAHLKLCESSATCSFPACQARTSFWRCCLYSEAYCSRKKPEMVALRHSSSSGSPGATCNTWRTGYRGSTNRQARSLLAHGCPLGIY